MVINMEITLLVISVILIVLVLLQSNKASAGGQIITGGNAELFQKTKERGVKKVYLLVTFALFTKGTAKFNDAFSKGYFETTSQFQALLSYLYNQSFLHNKSKVHFSVLLSEVRPNAP